MNNSLQIYVFRAKLKAVRLQNYWRKVCEDEKRSQARNEQLLLDIEKMEAHMATLAQRTQKLDQMKVNLCLLGWSSQRSALCTS